MSMKIFLIALGLGALTLPATRAVHGQQDYRKCPVSQEEFEKNERMKARVGSDVILPCFPKFGINSKDYNLEWSKDGREIFVIRNEHPHIADSSYENRLTVPIEEFKKGNASLKISGVKEADAGVYCCCVHQDNEEIKCTNVTLVKESPADQRENKDLSPTKDSVGTSEGVPVEHVAALVAPFLVVAALVLAYSRCRPWQRRKGDNGQNTRTNHEHVPLNNRGNANNAEGN